MRKTNIILLILLLVMAIGWGIVYWFFFADTVING
ncbi:flagellar basal body-associated protein FliL [Planomicrobium sp. HSC-17F08]|nr:flagellar basal body-associated protein FliL [Planomicrobium sp. HSC-17F08]